MSGQMPRAIRTYVRVVDAVNYRVGRIMMYGIFVMFGVLLWSSISKTFLTPSSWTLEVAQFAMVAYYIMCGPYSMQLGGHVRMDLFYGNWSEKTKAWADAFSVLFLIFFLGVLVYGAYDSTAYSFKYGERSATAWRPYMWPIKTTISAGFFLMLLQAISEFFKDVAKIRGRTL